MANNNRNKGKNPTAGTQTPVKTPVINKTEQEETVIDNPVEIKKEVPTPPVVETVPAVEEPVAKTQEPLQQTPVAEAIKQVVTPPTPPVEPVVKIAPQPVVNQQALEPVIQTQQTLVSQVTNKVSEKMNDLTQNISGMAARVNTPVANTLNYPKLAGVMIGSYVALEALHHIALTGYVMPYLTTTFALGATAANVILYGALGLGALGLSYLAYKIFFHSPKTVPAGQQVQFTPVAQQ